MIGNPYATPLPGSPGYPTKPTALGMPTQYQDTSPKHWDGIGTGGGGDKFPLPGDAPGWMPGGEFPGAPDQMQPPPYNGLSGLDGMLQQRKANDERRQILAAMLANRQQPQGPAPYANAPAPIITPAPIAQASPWSIVAAAFNGLADGFKKSKAAGQPTEEGANAFLGSNGGMKS